MSARRLLATLAVPLAGLTLLGACSRAEDAAKGAASNAACSLARRAVSGVEGRADDAADDIGADPAAARKRLTALRDTVKAAESHVGGATKAKLAEAREALDDLVDQAGQAARGTDVDVSAVSTAKDHLGEAVDGIGDLC